MSEVLALPLLFDAVSAILATDVTPAPTLAFGWKEAAKQINQGTGRANRIVFAPGDESYGFGRDLPPDKPGRNPRPLATEEELFTVFIWAVNRSDVSERAQYEAARFLYDGWRRAMYLVTHTDGDTGIGPMTILSQRWNKGAGGKMVERPFGAEIIAVCSVQAMVPDLADAELTAADNVASDTTVHELTTVTRMVVTPTT
jgi:hypothetical protein